MVNSPGHDELFVVPICLYPSIDGFDPVSILPAMWLSEIVSRSNVNVAIVLSPFV